MTFETEQVRQYDEKVKFGWKLMGSESKRHGPHHYTVYNISRDMDMPNYDRITYLENQYYAERAKLRYYSPVDAGLAFALFVFLIIPGVIYVTYKARQKDDIQTMNKLHHKKMDEFVEEARQLLKEY